MKRGSCQSRRAAYETIVRSPRAFADGRIGRSARHEMPTCELSHMSKYLSNTNSLPASPVHDVYHRYKSRQPARTSSLTYRGPSLGHFPATMPWRGVSCDDQLRGDTTSQNRQGCPVGPAGEGCPEARIRRRAAGIGEPNRVPEAGRAPPLTHRLTACRFPYRYSPQRQRQTNSFRETPTKLTNRPTPQGSRRLFVSDASFPPVSGQGVDQRR